MFSIEVGSVYPPRWDESKGSCEEWVGVHDGTIFPRLDWQLPTDLGTEPDFLFFRRSSDFSEKVLCILIHGFGNVTDGRQPRIRGKSEKPPIIDS